MAGKPGYDKNVSTGIILAALAQLGISATASGRNDLVIDTAEGVRKISGSAYRETQDRGFHHGTLLLNANLNRLADYLNPDPKKLQAKGITSVRSRVANLAEFRPDINHRQVCDAVIQAFFEHYGDTATAEIISPDVYPDLPDFAAQFARQSSWEWNFGKAPAFSHLLNERFVWGGVDIFFDVEKGVIERAQIFTDSLNPAPLQQLAESLVGSAYRSEAMASCCDSLTAQFPDQAAELAELRQWLVETIK